MTQKQIKKNKYIDYALSCFQIDGKPANECLTDSQRDIFSSLIFRDAKRLQIICSTQYGKSLVVALACVWIACVQKEVISVIAPSNDKAKIIMRYFIEHLGDHRRFETRLETNTRLDRLRQEGSKERIILRGGGGIFVVSAQSRNASKSIESAMGYGSKIVIGDEYCLVPTNAEATVFRMIAGKGKDAFYCKIGNPFYANPPYEHFKESWENPKYKKIFIDYKTGLKEGRYTEEFIEEAKKKPLFDVLYECKFPPENVQDEKGYRPLVLSEWVTRGDVNAEKLKVLIDEEINLRGELSEPVKVGVDISGGGDWNVYKAKWKNYSCLLSKNKSTNLMDQVAEIERIIDEYKVEDSDVNVDDIGVGKGVVDRCHEMGVYVTGVTAGNKADDEKFANLKAELCWKCREWIQDPNNLVDETEGYQQLTWLKYKVNSDKRIIIEPKEDLKKRHSGVSPDFAEAFYLCFYEEDFVGFL